MQELLNFVLKHWVILTSMIGFGWYIWQTVLKPHDAELKLWQTKSYWPELAAQYDCDKYSRYQQKLHSLNQGLERYWGKNPSWKAGLFKPLAFARSLQLAFMYPIMAAFLFWMLTGQADIGGLTLFDRTTPDWRRILGGILFLAAFLYLVIYHYPLNPERDSLVNEKRWPSMVLWFDPHPAIIDRNLFVVFFNCAFIGFSAFFSGSVLLVATFASAIASSFESIGIFVFGVIVTVVFVFAFAGTHEDILNIQLLLIFYVMFPFLNAAADYFSLAVTRGMMRRLALKNMSGWRVFGEVVIDLFVALFSFAALLALCAFTLNGFEWVTSDKLLFQWRDYLRGGLDDPWQWVFVLSMGVTTFVPSLVHGGVGLWSILHWNSRYKREAAKVLRAHSKDEITPVQEHMVKVKVVHLLRWAQIWQGIAVAVKFAFWMWVAYGAYSFVIMAYEESWLLQLAEYLATPAANLDVK